MEELEFEPWWEDFYRVNGDYKDGGATLMNRLFYTVNVFEKYKQIALIDEFIEHPDIDFSITCYLIKHFGNTEQKKIVREKTLDSLKHKDEDSMIRFYIDTILETYTENDKELIFDYFINHQADKWFYIPIKLFYIDKELFLSAYNKCLRSIENKFLYESDSYLHLAVNFEPFEFLIKNLSKQQSERLKKMALIKSKHQALSIEQKSKLLKLSTINTNASNWFIKAYNLIRSKQ